jgi:hypothetical protein
MKTDYSPALPSLETAKLPVSYTGKIFRQHVFRIMCGWIWPVDCLSDWLLFFQGPQHFMQNYAVWNGSCVISEPEVLPKCSHWYCPTCLTTSTWKRKYQASPKYYGLSKWESEENKIFTDLSLCQNLNVKYLITVTTILNTFSFLVVSVSMDSLFPTGYEL